MIQQLSPVQPIHDPLFDEKGIEVSIKRDDLIHPYVMGNKWRKLKYNLEYAKKQDYQGILTFGGAFSNHIAATAAACRENGFKSIGIIRGDELNPQSNPTLRFATGQGMDLRFCARSEFRRLREDATALATSYPGYYILPEGGTNALAIKGCVEIVAELEDRYDYLAVAMGTGGTMAGVLKGMQGSGMLIGYPSLKGDFIPTHFKQLLERHAIHFNNYEITNDFHFGGYGRVNDRLVRFINRTKETVGLLFDPIYTGKMYFGLLEMIRQESFARGSKVLVIHTGGLQGIDGYNETHEKRIMFK